MAGPKPRASNRVSQHFNLGRDQTTLDFVDVPIGEDVAVFLDPSRLRRLTSTWGSECASLLQHYFATLLKYLRANNKVAGVSLLSALIERNEFHLGMSAGRSAGRALGSGYAEAIWAEMISTRAAQTGLLRDLEDACLFIHGVGPDRISDAVCNIIRGPLIRYTQDMCGYYGIPMTPDVPSGPIWNPQAEIWEDAFIASPVTPFGKLLFVPKVAVRHRLTYDPQGYLTHYLLPEMQDSEKALNSSLVRTLKDGRKRVDKIALKEKYGADKLAISKQTVRHPNALNEYRTDALRTSTAITHEQLADIEGIERPKFKAMLDDVKKIPTGNKHAGAYEIAVEKLMSALFFPSLTSPVKQDRIHNGRKRIDLTYVNNPERGFFHWLSLHYPSAHVFVECKNYTEDIENPEFDQLSGRFSPSRGQVGLLVCRTVDERDKLTQSCKDTANDGRGYIVILTDDDLEKLVADYLDWDASAEYPLLMERFKQLVT